MLDRVAISDAVGVVDVAIDRVTAIANAKLPGAEDEVTQSTRAFRDFTPPTTSFGEVPLAQELARQHHAAHQVFVETVDGVIADLRDFRQKLLDSMKSHQNTDDAAHAALLSLSRSYDANHTFHAEQVYDQGRAEQGANLRTSHDGAPTQSDSGAQTTQPAPEADPAPSSAPATAPASPDGTAF